MGGLGVKYFKLKGRYYLVNGFQFGQDGPNADLGAVVFDVTGLPDTTKVKEVGPDPGHGVPRRLSQRVHRTSIRTAGCCCSRRFAGIGGTVHLRHGEIPGQDTDPGLDRQGAAARGDAAGDGRITGNGRPDQST